MGSQEESDAVDCTVGSIVWVRRRNGSWWPGKILGPDELSASHLMSPRSGTPVKLLGREDASVDWYNLEKSKRVKAFRCGEFDDCIEKAESTLGMPPKKREKYARREDAILHALELEKQLLKKPGKSGIASHHVSGKSSGASKRETVSSSESFGDENGRLGNSKLHQLSKDESSEVTPRMRGLQDLGLRADSKRKLSYSVASNGSQKPAVDTDTQELSSGRLDIGGAEHMEAISRAKRSKCIYLPAESGDSLESKENSSSQLEMLPSQFGERNCHPHPDSEGNASESTEDDESNSSEPESTESESDSSETDPDIDEEMTLLPEPNALGRPDALVQRGSLNGEEPHELPLSGAPSHLYSHDPIPATEAVSKWQLKGKRNIRNLTKRSLDVSGGKGYNHSSYGKYSKGKGSAWSQRISQLRSQINDFNDGIDEADFSESDFSTPMVGFDNTGYSLASGAALRGRNTYGASMIDRKALTWDDQPSYGGGYWMDKREHFGRRHLGGQMRSRLVDVNLKVQSSYQKEPVPIVSLMSKLNGNAIIGHPIQIEALEDGSSEALLPTVDVSDNEVTDHDGNRALPPAWRTARRTANYRVRRPHPLSALDNHEVPEDYPFVDQERASIKKSYAGSFSEKESVARKGLPQIPRPPTDRKFQRRVPKKVSMSSSQKTRTLSSIGIQQNNGSKGVHDSVNCHREGLGKTESSGAPTVACIPVKLVFSRLLEKINRPPSKVVSNVVSNNNTEKNSL